MVNIAYCKIFYIMVNPFSINRLLIVIAKQLNSNFQYSDNAYIN